MNKIYLLFSLTMFASASCFAVNCEQYAQTADKKSCLELNSLINQTQQNSMKVYNDSVAQAQSNLEKGQPSELTTPAVTAPAYQTQPSVVQPMVQPPQKQQQSQPQKRTRIYY